MGIFYIGLVLCISLSGFKSARVNPKYDRFPEYFLFGVGTSAYQIEGAWNVSGKGESTWDRGTHTTNYILDGSNGDVACDSYHKYLEDIRLLKQLKVHCYRFSIAWTRLFPYGSVNIINQDGVNFYNNLINGLLKEGIQPIVTIFHWDTPQALQDLGGWTSPKIVDWYYAYADKVFELFGDRVKTWATFNEPAVFCDMGYSVKFAPYLNSTGIGIYLCGHHIIKAHAQVYHMYQKKYKKTQNGRVGITLDSPWIEPKDPNSKDDLKAQELYLKSYFGRFAWPIFKTGNYPASMRRAIDKRSKEQGFPYSRLPKFTFSEQLMIFNSSDYLGLNHYVTKEVTSANEPTNPYPTQANDDNVILTINPNWNTTTVPEFTIRPESLRKLLVWTSKKLMKNLSIDITENGYNGDEEEGLEDTNRINYLIGYLQAVLDAMNQGVNVRSYTYWSFLDNFEWDKGYTRKFGLIHVDFNDPNRTRTAKKSAMVFQNIIATRKLDTSFKDS